MRGRPGERPDFAQRNNCCMTEICLAVVEHADQLRDRLVRCGTDASERYGRTPPQHHVFAGIHERFGQDRNGIARVRSNLAKPLGNLPSDKVVVLVIAPGQGVGVAVHVGDHRDEDINEVNGVHGGGDAEHGVDDEQLGGVEGESAAEETGA